MAAASPPKNCEISEPRAAAIRRPQEGVEGMPLQHDNGRDPAHPVYECDPGFGGGQHLLGDVALSLANRAVTAEGACPPARRLHPAKGI